MSPSGTTAPPSTGILFTLPRETNPTHCPSGEKNGAMAASVPGNSMAFGSSSRRVNNFVGVPDSQASRVPSGEMATLLP